MTYTSVGVVIMAFALLAGCSSSSNSEDIAQPLDDELTEADDSSISDPSLGDPSSTAPSSEPINPVVVDDIPSPTAVSHRYENGEFLVSWSLADEAPELLGFELTLNGVMLDAADIQVLPDGDRFGYNVIDPPFGRSVFEVWSMHDQGTSAPALQWLFNDPGRHQRSSNAGIVGAPVERDFFEFPVRRLATLDHDNLVSIALVMMNALQVTPSSRSEALEVFSSGSTISEQTDVLTGVGIAQIGQAHTNVFLCENAGRAGFHEFRAGGVIREFDQRVYADCAMDGNIVDGRFEESLFTTDGSPAGVVLDERVVLNVSSLAVSDNLVSGSFTIRPFVGEGERLNVTIEESFVMLSGGLYSSGVMTAVAEDGSTLTIDATTADDRTVSYSAVTQASFTSGTLPWPQSNLPSPPANVTLEIANDTPIALLWPGATDDTPDSVRFEIQQDGIDVAVITSQGRDFVSSRRTNFDAGYFRYPEPFSSQPLDRGLYTIVSVDAEGNRSDAVGIRVE